MHDVNKRCRVQPDCEHGDCQRTQNYEFPGIQIFEPGYTVVGHITEHNSLDHPQGIGRTEHQYRRSQKCEPEIGFEAGNDDHEFTDKPGRSGQTGVCQTEKHHERGKNRHRVNDAAIVVDHSAMQAVIHHADTQEQCPGYQTMGKHLHHAAFNTQSGTGAAKRPGSGQNKKYRKEPECDEPHMGNG